MHNLVHRRPFRLLEGLALALIAGMFLFPFLWMLVTAFKSKPEVLQFPPTWIPQEWRWDNFAAAWNSGPFGRYVLNNVIVAVSILALQLLTGIPAAYAFARFRFKGRGLLFSLVLLALMIPSQVVFLPIYVQMSGWNLINTLWALILPFGASAFGIFLIRQAFMQIPEDMMEAARLDHATEWTIMWRIAVPMGKPAVTTFALFSLIYHWNDYFWPLIMTNQAAMRTLPVGIAMLKETEGISAWNVLMAGNLMLVVPALLLFVLAQRHIMEAFVYSTK
ncbi:carbohydrate ABC transporter permease [Paenibacillus dendritiformis]|uniref:carbohydrate ABC transporter permease n=1 Tax=Paenibacillus dendritiformis TaxID=130049 RepID=UPI000DAA8589|nr:carbohydrate ABC transporter permease [Paenibacillus dendritiformis]PZM64560.1 carbohydrate ABC transporter permease [Paenibacillus dendritiformis]